MSRSVPVLDLTFAAGADLSGAQYKFVKISADDTVTLAGLADEATIGVVTTVPFNAAGAAVTVRPISCGGTVEIMCAAALAVGTLVGPDANGKAAAAAATKPYYAKLLQASGADGDIVEALLISGHKPA